VTLDKLKKMAVEAMMTKKEESFIALYQSKLEHIEQLKARAAVLEKDIKKEQEILENMTLENFLPACPYVSHDPVVGRLIHTPQGLKRLGEQYIDQRGNVCIA
jgi:hypothetical protein